MAEMAAAALVLVPLILLTGTALYLLRLGMTAAEMTEAARQRLAGLGVLLLYVAVLAGLVAFGAGLFYLARVLRIA